MFLWGKNNATFHWINEGIHSINAEISISVVTYMYTIRKNEIYTKLTQDEQFVV